MHTLTRQARNFVFDWIVDFLDSHETQTYLNGTSLSG